MNLLPISETIYMVLISEVLKRLYTIVICTYFISSAIPVTTIRTE